MSYVSLDVESDGPLLGINSMVSFGAVIVEPSLSKTFYAEVKPISTQYVPEALAISGFTRKQHEGFEDPKTVFERFDIWLKENSIKQPILISDNPGYDSSWINYYFHYFLGRNPFGWSSRRIGDLYCGLVKDSRAKWKHLRKPYIHSHNALEDSLGNANAILELQKMGLKIKLE